MKKNLFLLFVLFNSFVFAQQYKIKYADYNTNGSGVPFLGTTKPYSIERNIPLDKISVFSEAELQEYIKQYKQKLLNTRAFDSIEISYEVIDSENTEETSYSDIILKVSLTDSIHLLALPYFKYDSNKGAQLKLKAKDTNFLGTLNTMSTDIVLNIEHNEESNGVDFAPGFNFEYDFPFKAGIFDATWINNYGFSYTVGSELPEWDAKTGLKFELPFDRIAYSFEFYQSFFNNLEYKEEYDDALYFNEEAKFSVPLSLFYSDIFGTVKYAPYIDFNFNWDMNHIDENNSDLSSPVLEIGHEFNTEKINWNDNFRNGLEFTLKNSFAYNFQRQMFYPLISFEALFFKDFDLFPINMLNHFGITTDFYYFIYIINSENDPYFHKDGEKIGQRLRGIRDEQLYANYPGAACLQTSAFVLNLDFPVRLFKTNFNSRFLNYFNCDVQLSPFVDIGLTYNKSTKQWYNPKDGFYSAGFEVLVYPRKWSSFTVRAMAGCDIGRLLFDDFINMDWRSDVSKFEFSIGVGLHY